MRPTDERARSAGGVGSIVEFRCGCVTRVLKTWCDWLRCEHHKYPEELLVSGLPDGSLRIIAKEYNIDQAPDGSVTATRVVRPKTLSVVKAGP